MKKHKNLQAKGFRKKYFSLAAILALNSLLFAQNQNISMQETSKEASKEQIKLSITNRAFVENEDFKEEFLKEDIAKSKAKNLYDFLNTHSLLNITSSYGNNYTQNIDLRGFGQNGHKNIAIIIDGVRLENIDSTPVSLNSIPLDSIENIQLIYSKGTAKYGNGAVSGILKITTTKKSGGALNLSYGSFNAKDSQFFIREVGDKINIGAHGQYKQNDGVRYLHANSDEKDGGYFKNGAINAFIYPNDSLILKSHINYSKYGIKYANPITKEAFLQNPKLNGNGFTHQKRWDLGYGFGFVQFNTQNLTTEVNLSGNRNSNNYVNFNNKFEGKGVGLDLNSNYRDSNFALELGANAKQNELKSALKSQVSSLLLYLQAEKYLQNTTINGAISAQRILTKQDGIFSKQDNKIGGEFGINYALNSQTSIFTNFSRSFIIPNVDFMQGYDENYKPILNPHINTATFDTLQIGAKRFFAIHSLSAQGFVIYGRNEAYYGFSEISGIFSNHSFDKTMRIGAEAAFTTQFSDTLSSKISYAFVDATIQSGIYKNKEIPGISKHIFNTTLNYSPIKSLNLGINYKFGSKMRDYNDFSNTQEKSPNFQSLNANISYNYKGIEFYAFANNLTNHKNAIVVSGAYYPYNFLTSFGGGVKYAW